MRGRVALLAEAFGDHPVTIAMAVRAQDAWWRSARAFGAGARVSRAAGRSGAPAARLARRDRRSLNGPGAVSDRGLEP
jgi:hypothetical protein